MESPTNSKYTISSLYKMRTIWEALSDTFTFFLLNFKQIIIPLLIFVWPVRLGITYLIIRLHGGTFDIIPLYDAASVWSRPFTYGTYVMSIYIGFLSIIANIIIVIYIRQLEENKQAPSLADIFLEYGDIFIKPLVLIIVAAIIIGLGTLFIIIPGIYFAVLFSLAVPILIIEQTTVPDTMDRCFKLIEKNFWRTLKFITVLYIVSYALNILATSPLILYTIIFPDQYLTPVPTTILNILFQLISTITSGLFITGITIWYFSLTEEKYSQVAQPSIDNKHGSHTSDTENYPADRE